MTTDNNISFFNESRKWMALAILLLLGWALYSLSAVLTPFIMGAVLAYLGDPLVDRLERKKIPRTFGVVIVFFIFSTIAVVSLLMLIPLVERQIIIVYKSIPGTLNWLNTSAIPWIVERTGLSLETLEPDAINEAIKKHFYSAGTLLANILAGVGTSGMALAVWLTNLILVPVVAFYLMRDWDVIVKNIQDMLPQKKVSVINELATEIDEVLGAFLRGQMLVMFTLGVIYATGLWIVGLNVALIIGMIAGLTSIVPYLGFIVGILAAIIASIIQFGDFSIILHIVIVFGIGQIFESVLLTPLLVGDKIGLHPVAVIFAIMAGGQLFGFIGILIALPVAAAAMVLLRHMYLLYKSSNIYSSEQNLTTLEKVNDEEIIESLEDEEVSEISDDMNLTNEQPSKT